jgi:hypothetical protein|tara:strand:- start:7000 stop:8670 length:1671 start_codon:yes stop_codon:yes gene_type:complete
MEAIGIAIANAAKWIAGTALGLTEGTAIYNAAVWTATTIITGVPLYFAAQAMLPKMATMLGRTDTIRSPIQSRKIIYGKTVVGGTILYISESEIAGNIDRGNLYVLLAIAGHEVEAYETVFFDGEPLTIVNGQVEGPNRYYPDPSSGDHYANIDTTMRGQSGQTQNSNFVTYTDLTAADTFDGIACIPMILGYNQTIFVNGIPNLTVSCKGAKLFDPRDNSTSWSDNPALAIRDYLTNTRYGLSVPAARIDDTTFSSAANLCDELVTLDDGSTQKRYTCNGVIDTAASFQDNLETLTSALAGNLTYSGGKFKLYGGEWRAPSANITESDLIATMEIHTKNSRRDQFNTVRGIFVGAETDNIPADYPTITNSGYVSEDSEVLEKEMPLPMTNTAVECERIAKIHLERNRRQIVLSLQLSIKQFALEPLQVVNVTLPSLGFNNKTFEVIGWQLDNLGEVLGVSVTLKETDAQVYGWTSAEEIGFTQTSAPTATNYMDVATPASSLAVVSTTGEDGTIQDVLEVTITDNPNDPHQIEYDVYYKENTETNFETISALRDV